MLIGLNHCWTFYILFILNQPKYISPHWISKFPTNLNFQFRRKIKNILLYPLLISVSCLLIFQCTIFEMFVMTDKGNPRACHVYEKIGGKNDYEDEICYVINFEGGK